MPSYVSSTPTPTVFGGDDTWIGVTTDRPIPNRAVCAFIISAPGPIAGETLYFAAGGLRINFTVSAVPTASSTDWPSMPVGEALADYLVRVRLFLLENHDISTRFNVSVVLPNRIELTQKVFGPLSFSGTRGVLTNMTLQTLDVSTTDTENTAHVQVYGSGDILLLDTVSPYEGQTTEINLKAAFYGLKPHLPAPGSMAQAGATTAIEVCAESLLNYYLRAADRFGVPPVSQALVKQPGEYYALHGSRAADSLYQTDSRLRHIQVADYPVPVSRTQPNWVYVWTGDLIEPTEMEILCGLYINGEIAQNIDPYPNDSVIIQPNTLYCFAAGFPQMRLVFNNEEEKTGYEWCLKISATAQIYASRYFNLNNKGEPNRNIILLYDNGIGGMETVTLYGHFGAAVDVEKDTYRITRTPDFSAKNGEYADLMPTARRKWTAHTGWHESEQYVTSLAQLLIGSAWIVDTINQRFLKVSITDKSVEIKPQDETMLYGFSITFVSAWADEAIN